jgi:hypothetical protein
MPVLYKPFQSNLEDKKSGKKLFYPHVVRTGNINSAQLSKEIDYSCSHHPLNIYMLIVLILMKVQIPFYLFRKHWYDI